ncbi:MAG TPA: hypothetical protein VGJ36_02945 [Gemmatimonadales bacterium]
MPPRSRWHPDGGARESEIDRKAMADLVGAGGHATYQARLMILGGSSDQWSAWLEQGVVSLAGAGEPS